MSGVEVYQAREEYLGDGSLAEYAFDFKITSLNHLRIIKVDDSGEVVFDRLADDDDIATYVSDVTFDAVRGEGTVTLVDELEDGYHLILQLWHEDPSQPSEFKGKRDFSMQAIEAALDFIVTAVQTLAFKSKRALRMSDSLRSDELVDFDPTIEMPHANQVLVANEDGTGFTWGPEVSEIEAQLDATIASAAAAASSETAAIASAAAAAASEAAAIASAAAVGSASDLVTVEHAVVNGQAATDLTGETFDSTVYESIILFYQIIRGTTVFSSGWMSLCYFNGAWEILPWADNKPDLASVHGVTFSLSGTLVAQLRAALDVGAGDGTIKLKRFRFEV